MIKEAGIYNEVSSLALVLEQELTVQIDVPGLRRFGYQQGYVHPRRGGQDTRLDLTNCFSQLLASWETPVSMDTSSCKLSPSALS